MGDGGLGFVEPVDCTSGEDGMEGGSGVDSTVGETGRRKELSGAMRGKNAGTESELSVEDVRPPIVDRP